MRERTLAKGMDADGASDETGGRISLASDRSSVAIAVASDCCPLDESPAAEVSDPGRPCEWLSGLEERGLEVVDLVVEEAAC